MSRFSLLLIVCVALAASPGGGADPVDPETSHHVQLGLRLPVGFDVTEFAGSDLANDIYCMTVDPKGRIVVAGRGYIRILVDDNGDGKADRAIDFADSPKDGAMGMLWEEDTLYVTGDGGLRRFRDADGDGRADGPSTLLRAMKSGGEHTAHALRRGPDGWLYVLGGDGTGFDKSFATVPTSPVKEPIGGCVVRFPLDLKQSEIVAHGFRNAYDMDFNPDGELFTYDSDNERCVSLPWYEPTRFYHVLPGGHHGWLAPQRAQFFRLPPYFPDVVAPVTTLGRGSPTACVCYRHVQFPRKYRGGFFLADWTFGRVYFLSLRRTAVGYQAAPEVFIQSTADGGFAPTSMVVHPKTGDLFVAIGGRGTRGAVYRVRSTIPGERIDAREVDRLQPRQRSLEWTSALKHEILEQAHNPDALTRLRALNQMHRHQSHFTSAEKLEALRLLDWESKGSVQMARARLVPTLDMKDRTWVRDIENPRVRLVHYLAGDQPDCSGQIQFGAKLVHEPASVGIDPMFGLRLMQLALGESPPKGLKGTLWEGYAVERRAGLAAAAVEAALQEMRAHMPFRHADENREATRVLALAEDASSHALEIVRHFLDRQSNPVDDFHYLAVIARLRAPRSPENTREIAAALLALDQKIVQQNLPRERNWYARLGELHAELAKKDPALNAALLAHAEFGRPDHVLFARAKGIDQPKAARLLLKRAESDPDYAWSPDLVKLIGTLPDSECFPVLRRQWEQVGLQEAILEVLGRNPSREDHSRFIAGLASPQLETVSHCVRALQRLHTLSGAGDLLAVCQALQHLPDGNETKELADSLLKLLGEATNLATPPTDRAGWLAWFRAAHPTLAARLDGPDDVNLPAWRQRLERLDWTSGKAENGRKIYQRLGCAACHAGGNALGPDLHGVTGRFSRDDLFTAILQPSKEVPTRYQTVLISTHYGKFYSGAIIYEAVDGVMLQVSATTTVRIAGEQIAQRRPSPRSLMPAGLLDKCADQEIVDLYGYLKELKK
jgi:putative membrane-bound dehydrogenase-like protein